MKSVDKFVDSLFEDVEGHGNDRGNLVFRTHLSAERYKIDFAEDFRADGWQQFDTDQDAWYFGVWVNPVRLLTLTYAEGDWHLVRCPDKAHYNAEIRSYCEFYGEGFICKTFGEDGETTYVQDRTAFLVEE